MTIPEPRRARAVEAETRARSSALPVWGKSALAAIVLVSAITGGAYFASGTALFSRASDTMTEQQRHDRLIAFNNMGPVAMAPVSQQDMPRALASMGLAAQEVDSLQTDTASPAAPTQTSTPTPALQPGQGAKAERVKQAAPAAQQHAVQLAWITLWDTDAEDGDVVRIDSQGYSRTVVLKKQPLTFAVPVPKNGVINVTGVRDGDGGGITVGVGSGDVKAVFPIMSEGQTLALHVKVN
ncbi:MAG TPA: hypothetical protein VIF60_10820 [Burkholderiaceae bacterium]